jgi:uncharacterized protein
MNKKVWLGTCLGLVLLAAASGLTGCGKAAAADGTVTSVQLSQQPQGIWVNGTGQVTVTPDIALLTVGIVSQETTVANALAKASDAMSRVMKSLTDSGIAQKDIQTGSFNISQRTTWDNQKQVETTIGYQVSNMVSVKIRETAKAGTVIDTTVRAGGDLIRINGISFSVEDPTSYYQQAREKAMADAKNKAQQLASLAGLSLGKPTYVVEGAQSSPVYDSFRSAGMAVPAPTMAAPTSISPGETRVTLNVQVAYSVSQ